MEVGASFVEGAIHLGLFVAAGAFLATGALAALSRMSGEPGLRLRWVGLSGAIFCALFVGERLYHAL